jgi:hypothetical protein
MVSLLHITYLHNLQIFGTEETHGIEISEEGSDLPIPTASAPAPNHSPWGAGGAGLGIGVVNSLEPELLL